LVRSSEKGVFFIFKICENQKRGLGFP